MKRIEEYLVKQSRPADTIIMRPSPPNISKDDKKTPFPLQRQEDSARLKTAALEGKERFVVTVIRCSDNAVFTAGTLYDDIDRANAAACNLMWSQFGDPADTSVLENNKGLDSRNLFMVLSFHFKGKCVGCVSKVYV